VLGITLEKDTILDIFTRLGFTYEENNHEILVTVPTRRVDISIAEDLIEEVQRLRMENEYLKKLNALVQERIKRENKKK